MAYKKFHGITLAANSSIENMVIEPLGSDPTVPVAGQFWFNTTDKVVRYAKLDGAGAVIVRTLTDDEKVAADIAAHNATVQAQIAALGNAFNYISTLTGGADSANAFDMDGLPADQQDIGDYHKVASSGYFKWVDASSATQTVYANQNDGLVRNSAGGWDIIDNTNSNVAGTANEIAVTGSADTGFTVALDSTFTSRMSTAEANIASNQTNIGTLTNLTTTAQNDLVSAINEVKAAADTNAAAIAQEVTDRTAADVNLQDQIDTLNNNAGGGAEALRVAINNKIAIYTASSAATNHSFNHGLGGEDLTVELWVQDTGKWYNDSALIEMDPSTTTVNVPLTTAAVIKLIVEDKSAIPAAGA